jgi:hypothetical protein
VIAHTIQAALAPVFVLVAIGNIMNILSTRLGRIVDRARHLQKMHGETFGSEHDLVVVEMRMVDRRIVLNNRAIRVLVMAGLAIGATVAVLFVEDVANYPLERVAASVFMVAIALMMWGLTLFLQETSAATEQLRVPADYLESHRDLGD